MINKKNSLSKSLFLVMIAVLIACSFLSACSKPNTEAPQEEPQEAEDSQGEGEAQETQEEEEAAPEPSEEEKADMKARADKRKSEYIKVLREIYDNAATPEGDPLDVDTSFYEREGNQFAICDIDGDGEEELIFRFLTGPTAAMFERVYHYNTYSNELVRKLNVSPYNDYYTQGLVQVRASHNQTFSTFWPYSLHKFVEAAGEYVLLGFVSAWDKEISETDYEGNPFPDDVDEDGNGRIYYLYEREAVLTESEDEVGPIDDEAFNTWLEENMGEAEPVKLEYFALTKYNIDKYESSDSYVMEVDDSYERFTFGDIEYYLPHDFVEKVNIVETEESTTFYQKKSGEMGMKIMDDEEMGRLGSITKAGEEYYNIPRYKFLADANGELYILILPTDVQAIGPYYLDAAKEKNVETTEEELTEIMNEYDILADVMNDIHARVIE